MSDYQSGSDTEEAQAEVRHPFYDSAELTPTDEPESAEIVAEPEEEETELEAESPSSEVEEAEDEVEVFDKPDDFAKYDFNEESGLYEFNSEGKKVKVNPAQLIKSWREERKLTSELQKIADERKGLWGEAKQKELISLQEQARTHQEVVESLRQLVGDSEKSEEYWEELRETDIAEYTRQKELETKRKDALSKADADRVKAFQDQRKERIDAESIKLREAVGDEWKDQKVVAEEFSGMQEVATSFGLTPEEQNNIPDSRFWLAMREIMQFRKAKDNASKAKPVIKPTKTIKAQRSTPKEGPKSTAEIFYRS